MNCPSCGALIADGSSFCSSCGASIAQQTVPAPAAGQPAQPGYAAAPVQPGQPAQPVQPAQPAQPVQPGQPVQSGNVAYQQPPVQPGYATAGQPAQPGCQPAQPVSAAPAGAQKSKVAAGILGILLGSLGIHKFYLGYSKEGLIMILVSVLGSIFTLGIAAGVMGIIGLVEGIVYLTKTDDEFYRTYELGQKTWF